MTSEEMRLMEEKIETLFRTYYRNLVQYAEIILARSPCPTDPDRGEELVQETFALACSKWETFRASPNPVGWLYLTVNYLALNAMRADYRWCSHVVQDQDAYFVQDQKTSPPGGGAGVGRPHQSSGYGLASAAVSGWVHLQRDGPGDWCFPKCFCQADQPHQRTIPKEILGN